LFHRVKQFSDDFEYMINSYYRFSPPASGLSGIPAVKTRELSSPAWQSKKFKTISEYRQYLILFIIA